MRIKRDPMELQEPGRFDVVQEVVRNLSSPVRCFFILDSKLFKMKKANSGSSKSKN